MNKRMVHNTWFLSALTLLAVSIAGCGRETINVPDTTPPYVFLTSPALGAPNVAVGTPPITATFSKPVNCSTLTTTTFTVAVAGTGGAAVGGAVTCSGSTATFTPSSTTPLVLHTLYTAAITTGVTDLVGNAMVQNYVWNFEALPGPYVVSSTPVTGTSGLTFNPAISATFLQLPMTDPDYADAALNCSTVTSTGTTPTFTVTSSAGAVTGTVTCNQATATVTFTPTAPALLAAGTLYTATLTSGVQDVAGIGLASPYVSTFTTDIQPTVIASDDIPLNTASGVLLTQAISATFTKAMNCSSLSTTFTVTTGTTTVPGTVSCTGGGTGVIFTPTNPLATNTLYTATITTGALDAQGEPMVSNYAWNYTTVVAPPAPTVTSMTPANLASGVAANQSVSATFSQVMNPSTITGNSPATFTLTSGGTAVAGTVASSSAGATFTPTLLLAANTTYTATLTTGVQSAAGIGLANTAWTFTTDILPTVLSTVPANNATGVLLNQPISATFSKAMNCASLYSPATTFKVTGPGTTTVAGTVSCSGNGAIFTPSNLLATNTLYTAAITTGVTSAQGYPLASNYIWSFITVPAPTAPTVIATNPAAGATAVPTNQIIAATFSEAMNPATIGTATFALKATISGTAVTGTVAYDVSGSVAIFTPTTPSPLAKNTQYTATILGIVSGVTGVQDLAGNAMASSYSWSFTTGSGTSTTAPTVLSTIPVNPTNLAINVPPTQAVSATFSEAMNPATISGTTFTLTGPGTTGGAVAGLVSYAGIGNTATFTPAAALATGVYTATLTAGAQDLFGNALTANGGLALSWSFTVGVANTTMPSIISTVPAYLAINVPVTSTVRAIFTKAMNPLSIDTSTFTLTGPSGTAVTGTYAYSAATLTATFTPTGILQPNTIYTADITTGATDSTGNPLGPGLAPNPWIFTTANGVVVPPTVVLNSAAAFGDIGGTAGMTNQGIETAINNGGIGTTAVSTAVTGFHDTSVAQQAGVWPCIYTETTLNVGQVNSGTGNIGIYTAPPTPTSLACPNEGTANTLSIAQKAVADTLTAYNSMTPASMPGGTAVESCSSPQCIGSGGPGELGGRTLQAGVYKSSPGTYAITSSPLTLDGAGNSNSTWVFQMASSLTVGGTAPQSVLLEGGASCANVFWQVGSAAVINGAGGGTFCGTVISYSGATTGTAGITTITTINGRLLSLIGSVTLVNTVINVPAH